MKNLMMLALMAMIALGPSVQIAEARTTGESCQGDACDDVSFVFSGGCYRITNHANGRVRVHMGNISFGLERGQTHTLVNPFAPSTCLSAFRGSVRAYYN